MFFLKRTPNESEPLPSELKEPIAIANDLLYPQPPIGDSAVVAVGPQSGVSEESNSVSESGEVTLGKVRLGRCVMKPATIKNFFLLFLDSAKDGDASA